MLKLACIVSHPFQENTYVAHLEGRTDCLVFDPGLQPEQIVAHLDREGLTPAAILCTHGHADHIAGNGALKERWPDCPLVIGAGDASKLTSPDENLSGLLGLPLLSPPADAMVRGDDVYSAAGFDLEVREIPGHSSGHVVFVWRGGEPWHVFGGDVLFQRGIGRTDFPDGDFDLLRDGIHARLFDLPDDTIVYPGHGPETTVGAEKRLNPFVGRPAGYVDTPG